MEYFGQGGPNRAQRMFGTGMELGVIEGMVEGVARTGVLVSDDLFAVLVP